MPNEHADELVAFDYEVWIVFSSSCKIVIHPICHEPDDWVFKTITYMLLLI